jgi:glutamine amidotransferase
VASLRSHEMEQAVREHIRSGRPFLGVCLGMQMLFERSYEDGCHVGLGILPGEVVRFQNDANGLKVPHMGWNQLWFENEKPILAGIRPGDYVYYVHSYHVAPKDRAVIAAETDYGGWFCSVLSTGNIHATQFHPEKSQKVGLTILRNFARM